MPRIVLCEGVNKRKPFAFWRVVVSRRIIISYATISVHFVHNVEICMISPKR